MFEAARYLKAECGVRYWEDATVNGVTDADGALIPHRVGDAWCPVIDLQTGRIVGWPEGVSADLHYKVCDDGRYSLLDADHRVLATLDDYVPPIMSPGGQGYGDYVIMQIRPDGQIVDWRVHLDAFEEAA